MNYLSHYFVDFKVNSPIYNNGLMFPDFAGMISRKLHIRDLKHLAVDPDFLDGIFAHEALDIKWHRSEQFHACCDEIKKVLVEFHFEKAPYRPFFISHVAVEILLDRYLVKHHREVVDQLYVDSQWFVDRFWNVNGSCFPSEMQLAVQKFYVRFNELKYLYLFTDNERFIYTLNRTFQRVSNPELTFTSRESLDLFCLALDGKTSQFAKSIFDSFKF